MAGSDRTQKLLKQVKIEEGPVSYGAYNLIGTVPVNP